MNIEAELVNFLRAKTGVSTLLSDRLYQLKFPAAPTYPCGRVILLDDPAQYTHNGPNGLGAAQIQIDAADREASGVDPYASVTTLADAIDTAISGYVGPMGASSPAWDVRSVQRTARHATYDPDELRVLRIIQVYTIWYRPLTS